MRRNDPEPRIRIGPDFEDQWPGADALATECVLNFTFLAERCSAFAESLVRKHGVPSRAAFNVLTIVDGAGEPLPPSVIAERMIVTRPTVTGVIASLEQRGLVTRSPFAGDRRMVLIDVTPLGRERMKRARSDLHRAERRLMSCLTRRQQQAFLRMVAALQASALEL